MKRWDPQTGELMWNAAYYAFFWLIANFAVTLVVEILTL